jgi:hypothetical protein
VIGLEVYRARNHLPNADHERGDNHERPAYITHQVYKPEVIPGLTNLSHRHLDVAGSF